VLAKSNTVYAIDLLGLGASEKPSKFQYTMEIWAEASSFSFLSFYLIIHPLLVVCSMSGGLRSSMLVSQ
jgi:pimeloyl-ACP methyl ester carboxylesterase